MPGLPILASGTLVVLTITSPNVGVGSGVIVGVPIRVAEHPTKASVSKKMKL